MVSKRVGAAGAVIVASLLLAPAGSAGVGAMPARQAETGPTATPCTAAAGTTPVFAAPTIEATGEMAEMEIDQLFIDMMVPHHASLVAAAGAALTRLEHPQLRSVATDIILDQGAEMGELRTLRQQLYGDSMPAPIDQQMLAAMPSMPGLEGIDPGGLAVQLDPAAMANQICTAENVDLTFIDLTVAHHQVAIQMGQMTVDQAQSEDVRAIAAHDVQVQQGQIAELLQIREELTGAATPEAGGA